MKNMCLFLLLNTDMGIPVSTREDPSLKIPVSTD